MCILEEFSVWPKNLQPAGPGRSRGQQALSETELAAKLSESSTATDAQSTESESSNDIDKELEDIMKQLFMKKPTSQ